MIGNECADVIAEHAALHNHGQDVIVPPPTPDGNPFSHMYWIAAEDAATTACPTTSTKLAPLQNLKDKLKQRMTAHHRLGDAYTDSGYYRWWMNMLSTANTKTSNTFWTNSKVTFEQKRNVMQFRTGTLYNQKIAYKNGKASSPNCLLGRVVLCQRTDSQIHMLSGCQHETMRNMITERHNIATRLIAKAISKGEYGGSMIYTYVGSDSQTHRAKSYKS